MSSVFPAFVATHPETFPAPTKASNPISVGYDVYDIWDLGEFNQKGGIPTKYGTKTELKDMIAAAKEHGIVTYIDAVLNHKFGADSAETFEVSLFWELETDTDKWIGY